MFRLIDSLIPPRGTPTMPKQKTTNTAMMNANLLARFLLMILIEGAARSALFQPCRRLPYFFLVRK
jgi:hypothetical protein